MKRPLALALSLLAAPLGAQAPTSERGAAALGGMVEGLGVSARVLLVAAHPDDEDTRLITFLSRGRHADVGYLSLTRGDGGQNLIGNELGEALGVVRTEELLAARRVDGARQYFTRAYDFGFSKSAEETFRHWPRDTVLGDVVRVVRSFRPQVIVAVFSGTKRDGHGHHQASGILAREAYAAAADTVRFPARAFGPAWAPSKLYHGRTYWQHEGATLRYNAGEYSPLLGRSYAEVAAESRSQHKSQGFGSLQPKGAIVGSVAREATRVNASTPAAQERSIFDGLDAAWAPGAGADPARRALADSVRAAIAKVQAAPYVRDPSSLRAPRGAMEWAAWLDPDAPQSELFTGNAAGRLAGLMPDDARRAREARRRLGPLPEYAGLYDRWSRAVVAASGVAVEAQTDRELVARGDSVPVTITVYNRGRVPVRPSASIANGCTEARRIAPADSAPRPVVAPDSAARYAGAVRGGLGGPWWLARGRHGDLFATPPLAGPRGGVRTEAAASSGCAAEVLLHFPDGAAVRGPVTVVAPLVYRHADPVKGDVSRPLAAVPAVSVTLDQTAIMLPANAPVDQTVRVTLRSGAAAPREARVRLALPNGLAADSGARAAALPAFGTAQLEFRVRGRLAPGRHELRAVAESGGERFASGYTLIDYDHVRPQRVYRDAALALQAVDVQVPRGLRVAYVAGVGDNSAPALRALGVDLTVLDPAQLATAELARFTTVVVGPRAYEAVPELRAANARLLEWVRRGGTMVVQYGQAEMQEPGVMPYPITLARPADRVSVEEAPVAVLDAASPLLAAPNRITPADFAGWVQDRALYMPRTFDPRYAAPLSTNDPGEPANRGAILATAYGRGTYVYTTLAFFRQLPNGVPGAARLFVNLLAAKDVGRAVRP
jgi:LmbE family N-acetylglucosaminyl deacetylase